MGARWQIFDLVGGHRRYRCWLTFLSNTYVSPEDRKANPTQQKASVKGDATSITGFNKDKALGHAHFIAFGFGIPMALGSW